MNKNEIYFGKTSKNIEINNVCISGQNEDKFCKFEYITNLKNEIEFNNINLHCWMNLIFSIKQKFLMIK